jgi:hypothetical protein
MTNNILEKIILKKLKLKALRPLSETPQKKVPFLGFRLAP